MRKRKKAEGKNKKSGKEKDRRQREFLTPAYYKIQTVNQLHFERATERATGWLIHKQVRFFGNSWNEVESNGLHYQS